MTDMKKPLTDFKALAGKESIKGSGNAVKHGDRIAAAGACKQRSREMANYLGDYGTTDQHRKLHHEIGGCANYLVFHNYYTRDEIRLAKARTCKKHLLCPFCARARGAKLMEKNVERVAQALAENPRLVPAMLTLTVKNADDLKGASEHLLNSLRKGLKRRRDFKEKGRGWTEFAKIEGAIYATEVTYSEEKGWHPHIHAVVLLNDYIDQKAFSAEWERITGDSKVVDIRKLKTDDSGDVTDSLAEVFKYAVKFADLPLDKNLEAFEVLNGKRLIGSFGCLRGLQLPEKLTDDLLDDLPYIEMFYKYMAQKGAFELTETKKMDAALKVKDEGRTYYALNYGTGELTRNETEGLPNEQNEEENGEVSGQPRAGRDSDPQSERQLSGLRGADPLRSNLHREQALARALLEARDDSSADDDLSSFYLYGSTSPCP
jgi:hypothetical protein